MMNFFKVILVVLCITPMLLQAQINQRDSLGMITGKWEYKYMLNDSVDINLGLGNNKIAVSDFSLFMSGNFEGKNEIQNVLLVTFCNRGKRNGDFFLYLNDSILYARGYYKDDLLDGILQIFQYDDEGVIRCRNVGFYKNGKLNGPQLNCLNNISTVTNYNDGKINNASVMYFPNGEVKSYINNRKGGFCSNETYIIIDSNSYLISRKGESRIYKEGFWERTLVETNNKPRLKTVSHFERLFDKNRIKLLFKKRKLRKKYDYIFEINVSRKKYKKHTEYN